MVRPCKSARAVVFADVLIGAYDCPTEPECERFERFGDCNGCPEEPGKRPVGWAASPLTLEAQRLQRMTHSGLTVSMADLSPLAVEALDSFALAWEERREIAAQREAKEQARVDLLKHVKERLAADA